MHDYYEMYLHICDNIYSMYYIFQEVTITNYHENLQNLFGVYLRWYFNIFKMFQAYFVFIFIT